MLRKWPVTDDLLKIKVFTSKQLKPQPNGLDILDAHCKQQLLHIFQPRTSLVIWSHPKSPGVIMGHYEPAICCSHLVWANYSCSIVFNRGQSMVINVAYRYQHSEWEQWMLFHFQPLKNHLCAKCYDFQEVSCQEEGDCSPKTTGLTCVKNSCVCPFYQVG